MPFHIWYFNAQEVALLTGCSTTNMWFLLEVLNWYILKPDSIRRKTHSIGAWHGLVYRTVFRGTRHAVARTWPHSRSILPRTDNNTRLVFAPRVRSPPLPNLPARWKQFKKSTSAWVLGAIRWRRSPRGPLNGFPTLFFHDNAHVCLYVCMYVCIYEISV